MNLFSTSWRLAWAIVAVSFGVRAVVADQLYLSAWRAPFDPWKLDLAAKIFPQERAIATGYGYYHLLMNHPTEEALAAVRNASAFDPAAADLAEAEMVYAHGLGHVEEAAIAYARLKRLAPKSDIVKRIEAK
jgi:hypothetical protein